MLGRLVTHWRWRVERLRREVVEVRRKGESVESEEAWLWAIRIRILTLLIKRYGMEADVRRPVRPVPAQPAVVRETFCIVANPVYHGPRDAAKIRSLLDRMYATNRRRVRRWRRGDRAGISPSTTR